MNNDHELSSHALWNHVGDLYREKLDTNLPSTKRDAHESRLELTTRHSKPAKVSPDDTPAASKQAPRFNPANLKQPPRSSHPSYSRAKYGTDDSHRNAGAFIDVELLSHAASQPIYKTVHEDDQDFIKKIENIHDIWKKGSTEKEIGIPEQYDVVHDPLWQLFCLNSGDYSFDEWFVDQNPEYEALKKPVTQSTIHEVDHSKTMASLLKIPDQDHHLLTTHRDTATTGADHLITPDLQQDNFGINPKYVLGSGGNKKYQRYKKYYKKYHPLDPSRLSVKPPSHMLNMTMLGEKNSLTTLTLSPIQTAHLKSTHDYSHELVDISECKRPYIQSDQISILIPPFQDYSSARLKHLHFIMAGRDQTCVHVPLLEDHEHITTMLVLTQQQFDDEWLKQLPAGCGAVILAANTDTSINCRRLAALAAANWSTHHLATTRISLQDDNVASLHGFAETCTKLSTLEHAHSLFSFPNQKQKGAYTPASGKFLLMNSRLLTQFLAGQSQRLALLVPPHNLFLEDIWLMRRLIDDVNHLAHTVPTCHQGGYLVKSNQQVHAALNAFSDHHQTPTEKWIAATPLESEFIDEQDKQLFNEFKNHVTQVHNTILMVNQHYEAWCSTNINGKPLTELQSKIKPAPTTPSQPITLTDYQAFIVPEISRRLEHAAQKGETSSHVVLMLATGTGKTYSFLSLIKDHLSRPNAVQHRRCLVIAQRIDNGRDIFAKALRFDELKQNTVLICSDSAALDSEQLSRRSIQQEGSVVIITVLNSLQNAMAKDPQLVSKFDLFVFDEAHRFNHSTMEPFLALSRSTDHTHRIFIQASATPRPSHMEPGYLGNTLYVGNYNISTAERRGHIRPVIHNHRTNQEQYFTSSNFIQQMYAHSGENQHKLIVSLLARRLQDYDQPYQGRDRRVICFVKNSQTATACAEYIRENPQEFPHMQANAYHSRGISSTSRKQAMEAFTASIAHDPTPQTKILFAVDMLKEAVDIPGGVDFIVNLGNTNFTATQRTQIRGRAFRDSINRDIPAVFLDYSQHDTNEPLFYEETALYKKYDYSGDVIAAITIEQAGSPAETLLLRDAASNTNLVVDHVIESDTEVGVDAGDHQAHQFTAAEGVLDAFDVDLNLFNKDTTEDWLNSTLKNCN